MGAPCLTEYTDVQMLGPTDLSVTVVGKQVSLHCSQNVCQCKFSSEFKQYDYQLHAGYSLFL